MAVAVVVVMDKKGATEGKEDGKDWKSGCRKHNKNNTHAHKQTNKQTNKQPAAAGWQLARWKLAGGVGADLR